MKNLKSFKIFESGINFREKLSNIEEDIKDILLELIDSGKVRVGFNDPYRNNKYVMIRTSQSDKAIYWDDVQEYVDRIVDYLGDNFVQLKVRKHPNYREDRNKNINTEPDWIEVNTDDDNSDIDYGLWSVIIKFDIR